MIADKSTTAEKLVNTAEWLALADSKFSILAEWLALADSKFSILAEWLAFAFSKFSILRMSHNFSDFAWSKPKTIYIYISHVVKQYAYALAHKMCFCVL